MLRWLAGRLFQMGLISDETLNVLLLDGAANTTISMHTARAAARDERWACMLCAALSVLVQRGHCRHQLAGQPMTSWNYARAAACIGATIIAIAWAVGAAAQVIASL